jgi:hypothetical protein
LLTDKEKHHSTAWEENKQLGQKPAEWQVMFEDEVSSGLGSAVQVASITLQLAAVADDVVEEKLRKAFAKVAGVSNSHVFLLRVVAPELIGNSSEEKILTVNLGVVAPDPTAVMVMLNKMEDEEIKEILMAEAGLKYLKDSKFVDLKSISESLLNSNNFNSARVVT